MAPAPRAVAEIAARVRRGEVVLLPTETAYALAADATDADAVARVRRLKGRGGKAIALLAADARQVGRFFTLTRSERGIARRYWPGPLTLVLTPRPGALPVRRLSSTGRIGVRVPRLALARRVARLVGRPITATSANRSGGGECFSVAAARQSLGADLPALDAGRLPRRSPSTVAEVVGSTLRIHRRGAVRLPSHAAD